MRLPRGLTPLSLRGRLSSQTVLLIRPLRSRRAERLATHPRQPVRRLGVVARRRRPRLRAERARQVRRQADGRGLRDLPRRRSCPLFALLRLDDDGAGDHVVPALATLMDDEEHQQRDAADERAHQGGEHQLAEEEAPPADRLAVLHRHQPDPHDPSAEAGAAAGVGPPLVEPVSGPEDGCDDRGGQELAVGGDDGQRQQRLQSVDDAERQPVEHGGDESTAKAGDDDAPRNQPTHVASSVLFPGTAQGYRPPVLNRRSSTPSGTS